MNSARTVCEPNTYVGLLFTVVFNFAVPFVGSFLFVGGDGSADGINVARAAERCLIGSSALRILAPGGDDHGDNDEAGH